MSEQTRDYILECKGISKAFGGTQALKDVLEQLHNRAEKSGEPEEATGEVVGKHESR